MSTDKLSIFISKIDQMKTKTSWQTRFQELVLFKHHEGHCDIPQKYDENQKLANWANNQRAQYRLMNKGKPSPMSTDRIEALEVIGFRWALQRRYDSASWMKQFEELKQYKLQNGHCAVPQKYKCNTSLGRWVKELRTHYLLMQQGKPSRMSIARIEMLEDIEFTWQIKGDDSLLWYTLYEELKAFKLQKGSCDVPAKYKANQSLGNWVSEQRRTYRLMKEGKTSPMSEERIRSLNQIGFKWKMK